MAGSTQQLLQEAGRGGALGALAALLRGTAFQLDHEAEHRQLCAGVVYRLVVQLLAFDAGMHLEVMRSLVKVSEERARGGGGGVTGAAAAAAGAGAGSMALVPAGQGAGGAGGGAGAGVVVADDICALLRCLAAVFAAAPGLWFDELGGERHQLVSGLMSHVSNRGCERLRDDGITSSGIALGGVALQRALSQVVA